MIGIPSDIYKIDFAISKFNNSDMYRSGLRLFQALDFPFIPLITVINQEINDFIYFTLDKKVLFNKEELDFLNKINTISLLFSLKNENFLSYNSKNNFFNEVMFVAIEIISPIRDRSFNAHTITKILNKIVSKPIFVVFYHEKNILFSGIVYENLDIESSGEVFLSDWYPISDLEEQSLEKLSNLFYWNHSQKLLRDFYYDILYAISRDYYIYPESNEYVTYGCLSNELKYVILQDESSFSFKSIKEFAEENSRYYQNKYKEDYVDNNKDIELLMADDELLYIDFEENNFNEDDSDTYEYEEFDEYNEFNEMDEVDENENGLLEEMDDTLFDDPLKMLDWLENDDD